MEKRKRGKRYICVFVLGEAEVGITEEDLDGKSVRRRKYEPTGTSMCRLTRLLNHAAYENKGKWREIYGVRPVYTAVRPTGWDAVVEDRIRLDEWGKRVFDAR